MTVRDFRDTTPARPDTAQKTQLMRVLDAIQDLPVFSVSDIQVETGLPRKHVAAYITWLRSRGEVRGTGRFVRNYDRSRPAQLFSLVKP